MKTGKKIKLLFSLAVKTVPGYLWVLLFSTVCTGAQVLCNVILPKYLVDELSGNQELHRVLLFGALIVGTNLFFGWTTRFFKKKTDVYTPYVAGKMQQLLGDKIMKLDYAKLEDPYYLDLKERANFAITNQGVFSSTAQTVLQLLTSGVTLVSLTAILFTLSPLLVAVLLALVGVMLLMQKRYNKFLEIIMQELLPINRRMGYYLGLVDHMEIQKDIRLYDMAAMLSGRTVEYTKEAITEMAGVNTAEGKFQGQCSVINDLQAAIAYGYVGLRVLGLWGAKLTLGSFTMYASAAVQFSQSVTGAGGNVMEMQLLLSFLDPFMELMELEEEESVGEVPFCGPVETIEFSHVDFTYPGSDKKVLEDISFSVNKGEKISVVGLNGAGKSTLIKLLCRMYQPQSGRILVNGRDIFTYEYQSYMREVAAVFQDYKLFAFSIAENINCRPDGEADPRVEELIGQVGLAEKVASLPNGVHTLLNREYDENGTALSGGQGQKVAIARALYKDASLIILDEPTSALDPLAEAEIYENFHRLAGGKTAFYISHRMSSSVFCDRILVIDGGRIADYDSHEELMKKTDSLYYQLFNTQAENYAVE